MNKKKVVVASIVALLIILVVAQAVLGASWLRERKSTQQLNHEKKIADQTKAEEIENRGIISGRRIIGWYNKLPAILRGVYYKTSGNNVRDTRKIDDLHGSKPRFEERDTRKKPVREFDRIRQERGRRTPPSITGSVVMVDTVKKTRPLKSGRRTLGTAETAQSNDAGIWKGKYYRRTYPKKGELDDKTFVKLYE